MKKILLSIFLTSLISFIYTQCGIGGLYTQKDFKFCQPEPQVIEYGIFEKSSIVFEENFNCGSICNTAWLSTPNGGNFTNPIFPSPTNDTYFFTSGLSQREFTTGPLDVSNGGNVYFEFRYSQGVIDGPDMYDEGLQLQYSLDGINWVDYQYYAPTGIVFASWQVCIPAPNTSYFYAGWAQICFELTPAMISNGTQFRWVQPNFSGASLDNWGLDNIKIFANEGDYQYYHINHSSPYLLGTGTFVDSFIVSSDTNIIIWGVNFSNNMQTFDTLSVEFPVLDSIFIVNTSNESTSNANDGTLTIGGLTIGDNYTSGIGLANSTEYTFTGLSAGNYNLTLGNFQGCPSNIINYDIFLANTSPIAIVDSVTILEDNFINIPVLNNDNDPNSFLDPSSVSVVSPSVNGYTIIDPLSGIIFYEPFLNFNGVDSFEYYVCDDGVPTPILCDSAWVIVTVNPVNDLPVAINDYAITYENIPALIDVLANDYDIDPFGGINATSLMILVAPSNGTYVVNATTGQITYTPNNNYIGLDSFSYIICDTGNPLPGLCDTAAVYIEVIGLIIEGVISTSVSNPLQNSKIYLIDYIAISDSVFVVDSTFTNSTGFYQFTNVFQNAYVKAIPDFSIYPNEIPTYYTSSSVFQTANAISLTGGITNANYTTIAGVNPGGSGFISGIVGNGAGKKSEVGFPISGLSLILMNENNEVVKQTMTNSQGHFAFDDLEESDFSIWVDKSGINNNIAPLISLSTENSKEDLQFILHENYLEYKTSVEIKDLINSGFKIFPNPTNVSLHIQSEDENFNLELFNIIGEQVFIGKNIKQNVVIDLSEILISKGTYILKISNKEGSYFSKIIYR